MIVARRSAERGHFDFGWLDTRHTFSFGEYHDPRFMGFRDLRVINEDRVRGGEGFPPHGHRNMEIVTYVLDGALEHRDSMGNHGIIEPGMVQRMSAGTGVRHSEFNHSKSAPVHFLQIWILPRAGGLPQGYEQKAFGVDERTDSLRLVASPDGRQGSVRLEQDVSLHATLLSAGKSVSLPLAPGRSSWVQVVSGDVEVNGQRGAGGDGFALSDEDAVSLTATTDAHVLVFDLR